MTFVKFLTLKWKIYAENPQKALI